MGLRCEAEAASFWSWKNEGPDYSGPIESGRFSTRRQVQYRSPRCAVKLLLQGSYPCFCSPQNPRPEDRSVDPTGFEPASATVAGCCVAVTPRALQRVYSRYGRNHPISPRNLHYGAPKKEPQILIL